MDSEEYKNCLLYFTLNMIGQCKSLDEIFIIVDGAKNTYNKMDSFLVQEEIDA